jgi:hypothetical protein
MPIICLIDVIFCCSCILRTHIPSPSSKAEKLPAYQATYVELSVVTGTSTAEKLPVATGTPPAEKLPVYQATMTYELTNTFLSKFHLY